MHLLNQACDMPNGTINATFNANCADIYNKSKTASEGQHSHVIFHILYLYKYIFVIYSGGWSNTYFHHILSRHMLSLIFYQIYFCQPKLYSDYWSNTSFHCNISYIFCLLYFVRYIFEQKRYIQTVGLTLRFIVSYCMIYCLICYVKYVIIFRLSVEQRLHEQWLRCLQLLGEGSNR